MLDCETQVGKMTTPVALHCAVATQPQRCSLVKLKAKTAIWAPPLHPEAGIVDLLGGPAMQVYVGPDTVIRARGQL
jgi:hypothetical protein